MPVKSLALEMPRSFPTGAVPEKLSEYESKTLLREGGISRKADWSAISLRPAGALSGISFPVAMKIQLRDIPHKSEAGGVKVNVRDPGEAAAAFDGLVANARRFRRRPPMVLVEPMAAPGVEMIIGAVNDSTFGPIVMANAGWCRDRVIQGRGVSAWCRSMLRKPQPQIR